MSNHKITIIESIDGRKAQARCSCLQRSGLGSRGDVEEWIFHHNVLVEQVKANLHRGRASLKTTAVWFRSQQENTENSEADRALWQQLADEVDQHLTLRASPPPGEQLTLW